MFFRFFLLAAALIVSASVNAGWRINHATYPTPVGACYTDKASACGGVVLSGSATYTADFADGAGCRVHFESGSSQLVNYIECDLACPAGQERNEVGQCAVPLNCPEGVAIVGGVCDLVEDEPNSCVEGYAKLTIGGSVSCVPNPQDPDSCGSQGRVFINGKEACAEEKNACNAAGGTFGIVGTKATCLPSDYSNNLPTCSQGSAEFVDNGTGSYAFACATSVNTPEQQNPPATIAENDPTGLGGKLDGIRGALDQQTAKLTQAIAGINGGVEDGEGEGEEGEGDEEGDCDPESNEYMACVAQVGEMPGHTTTSAATTGEAFTNFMTALSATPIAEVASGIGDAFSGIGGGACPQPQFSLWGENFTLSLHCELFDQAGIGNIIYGCMTVFWVVVGLRNIASA